MTQAKLPPFHLAIQVHDLKAARRFYGELMGCAEGRSSEGWVDFNFCGHQLVCHLNPEMPSAQEQAVKNPVDGMGVPVPHFGVVLDRPAWSGLAQRLQDRELNFVIAPTVRFEGEVGEQATMFFLDPSGNALEIKAFADVEGQLFAV